MTPRTQLSTSNAFSAGITTYTSDAAGNLLTSLNPSDQRTTNTWDFENRLTQVALPSAIVDTFTYNGDGQRVQKIDSTGTTKHVWDGQNILLETDGSNIIQVVYTLQPMLYGNLISQWRSGIGSFYLFDGLGSTTQLANSTGSVTDSYLYDSFGNILLASGSTANRFAYAGRMGYYYEEDLADYHVRARYYAPGIGEFLSRDPIQLLMANCGPYTYARSSPSALVDPSGLLAVVPAPPFVVFTFCCVAFEAGALVGTCVASVTTEPLGNCVGELIYGPTVYGPPIAPGPIEVNPKRRRRDKCQAALIECLESPMQSLPQRCEYCWDQCKATGGWPSGEYCDYRNYQPPRRRRRSDTCTMGGGN